MIDGVWTGSELRIDRHSRRRPEPDPGPAWDTPPCPPPAGGWAHGTNYAGNLDFDLGDLSDSGAAVMVVLFRPGAGQAVLVVAAADPEAVEARLRPVVLAPDHYRVLRRGGELQPLRRPLEPVHGSRSVLRVDFSCELRVERLHVPVDDGDSVAGDPHGESTRLDRPVRIRPQELLCLGRHLLLLVLDVRDDVLLYRERWHAWETSP